MNILNVFWGFIAEVAGLVIAFITYTILSPLLSNAQLVTANSTMYYLGWFSIFTIVVVFMFVVPITTIMSDEDGGTFKKIITAGK